ncbi:MAG: hypothetical protein JRN02_04205 [Nitrososphaerota archaeon]|nr:hypothetical protein [Nitrososphaerota archaeon]
MGDIEVVSAFDLDEKKVNQSLRSVIEYETGFKVQVPEIQVEGSILLDDLGREIKKFINPVKISERALIDKLAAEHPSVIVNLISAGLQRTSKRLAEIALEVDASYINCTPASVVSDKKLVDKFKQKGRVIIGDDLQSQLGGTWLHRTLLHAFRRWGGHVTKSYQLDVGGSRETLNTLDENIREVKKGIKSNAVNKEDRDTQVVTGTTDYIPFLKDGRVSNIYLEIEGPMGEKFTLDGEYKTFDGVNATNTLLDVIRAVDGAMEEGKAGAVDQIINYGFKNTINPVSMESALEDFENMFLK